MKKINGTIYSYSFLCWRKVWLFYHNITMEHNSENVAIGKQIDENSYEREKKHILVDGVINIDFLKDGIVYEIKKSSKQKDMAINQIKFYLFTLYKKGINNPRGVLCIPQERQREEVSLEEGDIEAIEARIKRIEEIASDSKVPEAILIKPCKSCSYYDLCYI